MRETNSNIDSSKASPPFFLFPKRKEKKRKKTLFAYRTCKPPITCHTQAAIGGGFQCSETRKVLTALAHYFVAGEQIAFGKYVHAFLGKTHL